MNSVLVATVWYRLTKKLKSCIPSRYTEKKLIKYSINSDVMFESLYIVLLNRPVCSNFLISTSGVYKIQGLVHQANKSARSSFLTIYLNAVIYFSQILPVQFLFHWLTHFLTSSLYTVLFSETCFESSTGKKSRLVLERKKKLDEATMRSEVVDHKMNLQL